MNKIYHVVINGRTLESRNLKELLARAVSTKRKLDCRVQGPVRFQAQTSAKNTANPRSQTRQAAAL